MTDIYPYNSDTDSEYSISISTQSSEELQYDDIEEYNVIQYIEEDEPHHTHMFIDNHCEQPGCEIDCGSEKVIKIILHHYTPTQEELTQYINTPKCINQCYLCDKLNNVMTNLL